MKTIRQGLLAFVVTLLTALTLVGCGGSGADNGSSAEAPAAKKERAGAGQPADEEGSGLGKAGGSGKPVGPRNQVDPGKQPQGQPVKVDPNAARAIAYTATLRVRATNVEDAGARAKQLVSAAGGYVDNEVSAGGSGRVALTFKIPTVRYAATLDQLAQLGTKLELRQEAEDVTEEVADVDSRVRSARASVASFRKLLDRANTIGEVINVEEEIERRQAELEALQARQKTLAERVRHASVTLQLSGPSPAAAAPPKEQRGGFLGGLERGWDAFTAVVSRFLTVLGVLLPFLVTAAVLAIPGYLIVGFVRRKKPARRASA
jgi:uncharacterized protein DUF4349